MIGIRALVLSCLLLAGLAAAEQQLVVTPSSADATYAIGDQITWSVQADGSGVPVDKVAYVVKRGGLTDIGRGTLDLTSGAGTVTTTLDAPGTVLLVLTAKATQAGQKDLKSLALAVVAPQQIKPSQPVPEDFDAFWQAKLEELAAVPANPQLQSMPSERDGVDYWQITMDNIRGTRIRGQLAKPAREGRFPAMLIVQWAGVYGLPKTFVTGDAAAGWLVLNINAHDQPIDQPAEFYKQLGDTTLKGYTAIGNDDREQSYFLRMFLSCSRAVDYLAERPDWDGKVLLVTGGSQGGLQSLVTAGLNHKVTALAANVPAGCDNTAVDAGRIAGWPNWINAGGGKDAAKVHETARYFDGMNFASRITCPALIGYGLIDTTSRAEGVIATINALRGPVEAVPMINAGHGGKHDAYYKRNWAWKEALRTGKAPPIPAR